MKKFGLFLIAAVILSSCSLFQKPSMTQEEIDAMISQNAALQEELVNVKEDLSRQKMKAEECANVIAEMQKKEVATATGRYYVISGSFKTPDFATNYAAKMKQMGGEGAIIDGPSNFKLVSYSSHATLREAVTAMENTRANIASEAWVYMTK